MELSTVESIVLDRSVFRELECDEEHDDHDCTSSHIECNLRCCIADTVDDDTRDVMDHRHQLEFAGGD
jgi:hypothetical protein